MLLLQCFPSVYSFDRLAVISAVETPRRYPSLHCFQIEFMVCFATLRSNVRWEFLTMPYFTETSNKNFSFVARYHSSHQFTKLLGRRFSRRIMLRNMRTTVVHWYLSPGIIESLSINHPNRRQVDLMRNR